MTGIVLDASISVKWFRDEDGSRQARDLLRAHGRGEVALVVPSLFVYEMMGVAARTLDPPDLDELWSRFLTWRIAVHGVDDSIMRTALSVRAELGCSLYDAFAPALARRLGARLCSADRRAHAAWPDALLLG